MTAEDSDDDMEDVEEGIPMQGEDGQHYVVLEVRFNSMMNWSAAHWAENQQYTLHDFKAVSSPGDPTARAEWWSGCCSDWAWTQWASTSHYQVSFRYIDQQCSSPVNVCKGALRGCYTLLYINRSIAWYWLFIRSTSRSFSLLGEGSVILPPIMEVDAHINIIPTLHHC